MKKISLVVPVYNEEENVFPMYEACKSAMETIPHYDWELIFVNDGSKDNSLEVLRQCSKIDSRVIALDFSRNFGKEIALSAGVEHCSGDAAIFMDSDLQHPPSLIPQFVKKWEEGAEVVASIRKSTQKKSFFKDFGSRIFYSIIRHFGDAPLTRNATDFKLIDKKVMMQLASFTERNRMFRGLIDWMGFHTEYIEFEAPARLNGEASYSFKKLTQLAINSMTSFSLFPLRIAGWLGMFITLLSSLLLIFMLVVRFTPLAGMFSSISYVIVANTLVLGITLISLGLIALYIGQIHAEVINRPLYVIRETIQKESFDE